MGDLEKWWMKIYGMHLEHFNLGPIIKKIWIL